MSRLALFHRGPPPALSNLGINLGANDYFDGARPFSNLIYGSDWTITGNSNPEISLPSGHTDANGWPTSLPGTYTTLNRFLAIPIQSGTFIAKWTGTATVNIIGAQISGVDTSVPNQVTFTFATNYSDPSWFTTGAWTRLTASFSSGDPIKNLDVREVGKSTSQVLETDYLAAVAGYAVVRFINGFQIGVSTPANQTAPTITWAARNQIGAASFKVNDGVPIETMIDMANAAGVDPWFCMPWGAEDAYITGFATTVLSRLNSNRKVYVENDNEIWNYGFNATLQAKAEGLSEGLGGVTSGVTISSITHSGTTATVTTSSAHGMAVIAGGNDQSVKVVGASPSDYNAGWVDVASVPSTTTFTYVMPTTPATNATVVGTYSLQPITLSLLRRYAEKTAHVMGLWTTVFAGQTNRLVTVASFQNADTGNPPNTLAWTSNLLANAIDAIATAPYFAFFDADYSGQSLDTIMNTLLPAEIGTAMASAKLQSATAQSFGKRYIAYEAGQSVVLSAPNVAVNKSIQTDSRMYSLHGTYLFDWLTQCGGDIINMTNIAQPTSQFGAFGLVEFIGETVSLAMTPKQQLVNDWRNGIRLPQALGGTIASAVDSTNGFFCGAVTGFFPTSTLSIQSTGPTDGSGLAINSSTGNVTVADATKLPAAGSYTVTVRETNAAFPSPGYRETGIAWTEGAANLIVNGTFANTSTWSLGSGCTISGGVLNVTGAAISLCYQAITYVIGGVYQLDFDYTATSINQFARIEADLSNNGTDIKATSGFLNALSGHITLTFTADVASGFCHLIDTNAGLTGTIDNCTLRRTA